MDQNNCPSKCGQQFTLTHLANLLGRRLFEHRAGSRQDAMKRTQRQDLAQSSGHAHVTFGGPSLAAG